MKYCFLSCFAWIDVKIILLGFLKCSEGRIVLQTLSQFEKRIIIVKYLIHKKIDVFPWSWWRCWWFWHSQCYIIHQKGSDNNEKRLLLPPLQNWRFEVKAIVFSSIFHILWSIYRILSIYHFILFTLFLFCVFLWNILTFMYVDPAHIFHSICSI